MNASLTRNLPVAHCPLTLPSPPVGERVASGRVRGWFRGARRAVVRRILSRFRWIFTLLLALLTFASARAADTLAYAYDAAGRLVLLDYGDGRSVRYVFDASGNLLRRLVLTNTDSDSDGMDDTWETFFFGNLSRTGAGDADNDGQSDLAEFLAGTEPNNSASVLVVRRDFVAAGGTATIEWNAVPGKRYRVQFKDTVSDAAWQDLAGDVTAGAATASKVDTGITGRSQRYYRVILAP